MAMETNASSLPSSSPCSLGLSYLSLRTFQVDGKFLALPTLPAVSIGKVSACKCKKRLVKVPASKGQPINSIGVPADL